MKGIGDLLNESEQLRVETDDNGPQVLFCSYENFLIVFRAVRILFTSNGKNFRMKVVKKEPFVTVV